MLANVQAFEHDEDGTSLRGLLENKGITKWMCDCRRDSDAIYHQFGIRMQNVIDLQMAEVAARRCARMRFQLACWDQLTSCKMQQ